MYRIKSVGVLSAAKILSLIYGCVGLIFLPFFLLIISLQAFVPKDQGAFIGAFGVILAIAAPIVYAIMGFLIGAVGAFLYNLFAKLVGGFELELEPRPTGLVAPYPIVPPPTPSV
jgi:hypothetical protein